MVLAGLDLTVDEGELYGLIGPNGAGKTTALRVALGLLRADAGQVRLLGHHPRSAAGARNPYGDGRAAERRGAEGRQSRNPVGGEPPRLACLWQGPSSPRIEN